MEKTVHPIRVFLIDGEVVVRAGMRLLINSWRDCVVVGEADVAPSATVLQSVATDVVVLSHGGPNESPESLVKILRESYDNSLIVLTNADDPALVANAIKAGANGVVLKRDAADDLHAAILAVASGESSISASLTHGTRQDGALEQVPSRLLTNREREVALLISKGCTDRQVGAQLGVTEGSVRHHLNSIFGKLGIANRFELTAWVYRCKLVTS